jgi:hypothetical protein
MKDLFEAILYGMFTARRAVKEARGEEDPTWKIYLSALLGVFFAYTIANLFGVDPLQAWPYIVGLIAGLIYGACWYLRSR